MNIPFSLILVILAASSMFSLFIFSFLVASKNGDENIKRVIMNELNEKN